MNIKDKPLVSIEECIPIRQQLPDKFYCYLCFSEDCYDVIVQDNNNVIKMFYAKWQKIDEPLCKKHFRMIRRNEQIMWSITKFLLKKRRLFK